MTSFGGEAQNHPRVLSFAPPSILHQQSVVGAFHRTQQHGPHPAPSSPPRRRRQSCSSGTYDGASGPAESRPPAAAEGGGSVPARRANARVHEHPGLEDITWNVCSGAKNAALPAVNVTDHASPGGIGPRPALAANVAKQVNYALPGGCYAGQLSTSASTRPSRSAQRCGENTAATWPTTRTLDPMGGGGGGPVVVVVVGCY